jgi:predicted dehydrogenase
VENGTIGEIIDFKTKLYHKSYLDPNKKGAWRTKASSGGGALLDLGIHLIDIIHFTLGQTEKVKCSTDIFFKDRTSVDEMANCEIYLENGVKGSLEVSRIFANSLEPTTFTVYGTKGSLKMTSQRPHVLEIYDYNKDITCIKSAKQLEKILDYYPNERNSLGFAQDCHMASIVNFSNLILRETAENSITPTFKEALDAQKVVEAAYESNKSSRWVNIEEI